tara:strand:- start:1364 stop:2218 length:855 start_codon:yes stop_codon:yes gene_type:complete
MKNKIKLSSVTTYKFGGFCNNYYKITEENINQYKDIFSDKDNFILGKGSNVAFSDKDYAGNVIHPNFNKMFYNENTSEIIVGSSIYLPDLARFCKSNNLINAEFLIGIPGSVGGAIKMNAGAYGWEFSDLFISLDAYNFINKEYETLEKQQIKFGYRMSNNLEGKIIVSAKLSGIKGDPKLIKERLKEYTAYRKNTQPAGIYNAGSVFKNHKDYSAGELIDKAGLKGYEVDGVKVSSKHANFFIASKGSKSSSLYKLVNHVKDVVDNKFGVSLEKEIIFVGNFE